MKLVPKMMPIPWIIYEDREREKEFFKCAGQEQFKNYYFSGVLIVINRIVLAINKF